ncbi:MAG: hypothetical protein DI586_01450 [Micavibrio aeruginosavorus]|uniref:Uncharacterized protein n=1 Tax=Micavibrio aeruginosavorus TaxID=349221 RepID=A0A2W5FQ47_9BACT|nr:MAG: hypothetical protein DI586_01450 [Micavibrio aeruginosavorus]
MAFLTDEWQSQNISTPVLRGSAYAAQLKTALSQNRNYFKSYTTHDIATALRRLDKSKADYHILIPLYKAYKPESNHQFRAEDLAKRIELMRALENLDLPSGETDTVVNRWKALEKCNALAAEIYGHEKDTLRRVFRKAKIGHKNMATLSNGSHDLENRTIYINVQKNTRSNMVTTFHRGFIEAAVTAFHEARHTYQDSMSQNHPCAEYRDIACIMKLSSRGDYYLNKTHSSYLCNPGEVDAHDFESNIREFLSGSAEERIELISRLENQRLAHLAALSRPGVTYPQASMAIAA